MVYQRILDNHQVAENQALVVLNSMLPGLKEEVEKSGLPWVELKNWTPQKNDILIPCVLKPGTKKIVVADFNREKPECQLLWSNSIHPTAVISPSVQMGKGVFIEPGVVIANHTKLGDYVNINRSCSVGHHTTIGDYTMINPGVHVAGNVHIENSVQLGIGSSVFDGVRIGENSIIGGGSVVNRDIPPNVIAFGNPCKVIKPMML